MKNEHARESEEQVISVLESPRHDTVELKAEHSLYIPSTINNRMVQREPYIDRLRTALTALVVVFHAAITYGASGAWFYHEVEASLKPSSLLLTLFCATNQAYFMGFFFLLAGYFTPGSLERKGCARFPLDRCLRLGFIHQGKDAFYRRIVFPCFEGSRPINLYGRSVGGAAPHRFLPRPRGGLFAWSMVRPHPEVILVEGLFDPAVLWQAGFIKTSCAFGVHLTEPQFSQLSDRLDRTVFIAFDADEAGQNAARALAPRLQRAGLKVRRVDLRSGQDPNRYFVDGASAAEFARCLRSARCL
jgi:5S rRNA maturation endonuclease (ribonuclease M5)